MLLLIDNYDSFAHNLARYFRRLGCEVVVARNDAITLADVHALAPRAVVISPGPCTPREAGCSVELIRTFGARLPILGVCLGHQAIAVAYGGTVVRSAPVHGRTTAVYHGGAGMFADVPSPFDVCRYHSLVADPTTLPSELEVIAETRCGLVMAVRHREYAVVGVQFHPESVLTQYGYLLLANFLRQNGIACREPLPSVEEERGVASPPPENIPPHPVTF
jgi:anthranilate synthase/aminodeoxychorismate synthase-like glutamine amidotransferase